VDGSAWGRVEFSSAAEAAGSGYSGSASAAIFLAAYAFVLVGVMGVAWSAQGWTWSSLGESLSPRSAALLVCGLFALAGLPPFPSFFAKLGLLTSSSASWWALAGFLLAGVAAGWLAYVGAAYSVLESLRRSSTWSAKFRLAGGVILLALVVVVSLAFASDIATIVLYVH
jgi:NADH:ubiquinone oxidoreductase subunit 2 (subunit N)